MPIRNLSIIPKKINTFLTSLGAPSDIPLEIRLECIDRWASIVPRIMVIGPEEPLKADGIRWTKVKDVPPLANVFGAYIFQVPGTEIVAIGLPTFILGGDREGLMKFIDEKKIGLAWGCYSFSEEKKDVPSLFVMSAAVIPHIFNDIPKDLIFDGDAWAKWLHAWMSKYMQVHRYFDATSYGLVQPAPKPIPEPVLNAYEISPEPVAVAKPVKKSKKKKK